MRLWATVPLLGAFLLGGMLFWSTLAGFVYALGETASVAGKAITPRRGDALLATSTPLAAALASSPTAAVAATLPPDQSAGDRATPTALAAAAASTPTPTAPSATVATPASTPTPAASPTSAPTPRVAPIAEGRAPWILLPRPAPDARIPVGAVVLEARGRGDAPIREIRLELDGRAVASTLEQRSDSIWRAFATVPVSPGSHEARATVVDAEGRTGTYRWSFTAAP